MQRASTTLDRSDVVVEMFRKDVRMQCEQGADQLFLICAVVQILAVKVESKNIATRVLR